MSYFKNTKHWNVLNLCIAITIACTSTMACHLLFSTTAGLGLAPLLALTTTSLHRTCTCHNNFMVLHVWNPLLIFVIVRIVLIAFLTASNWSEIAASASAPAITLYLSPGTQKSPFVPDDVTTPCSQHTKIPPISRDLYTMAISPYAWEWVR